MQTLSHNFMPILMRYAILIISAFFFSPFLFSQTTQLGFSGNTIQVKAGVSSFSPDSVVVADLQPIIYQAFFENKGLTAFTGIIDLAIAPDTVGSLADIVASTGQNVTIGPGDTVGVAFPDTFDTSRNRYSQSGGGGVVVIVWPSVRTGNASPIDTIKVNFIPMVMSIDPEWANKGLNISYYPNPAETVLHIDYGDLVREIGYVRFLDNSGRVCIHSQKAIKEIDMEGWPAGIYYLYVGGKENQQAVYRIVKN